MSDDNLKALGLIPASITSFFFPLFYEGIKEIICKSGQPNLPLRWGGFENTIHKSITGRGGFGAKQISFESSLGQYKSDPVAIPSEIGFLLKLTAKLSLDWPQT